VDDLSMAHPCGNSLKFQMPLICEILGAQPLRVFIYCALPARGGLYATAALSPGPRTDSGARRTDAATQTYCATP
jgi:hypothetical protein